MKDENNPNNNESIDNGTAVTFANMELNELPKAVRRPSATRYTQETPSVSRRPSFELSNQTTPATTPGLSRTGSNVGILPGTEHEELDTRRIPGKIQSRPASLPTFFHEILFIWVCSCGQLFFSWCFGYVQINQTSLLSDLGIPTSQKPWLVAYLLADGLFVIIAGSLSDHISPKALFCGGFLFSAIWNLICGFSLGTSKYLFFFSRAMQGIASGVVSSTSISLMGRVYSPGQRKNRAFSAMASAAPMGYWFGTLHGALLSDHRPWIFWSFAIIATLVFVSSLYFVPNETEASPGISGLRQFDFLGAGVAVTGCALIVSGLTQGSPSEWAPYSYAMIIVGGLFLISLGYVERFATKPLIPNGIWKVRGFTGLMLSYFLGFGAYSAWQFYAIYFWQNFQNKTELITSLYLLPNALVGLICTFATAILLHVVPGHAILITSMVAFGLGPAFFLGNEPNTTYWALSMPAVALATLGPDLSFTAASIFITSNVPRSYQGSAGAFLITMQNLSSAVMTAVTDSVGISVMGGDPNTDLSMKALKAIWYFNFGGAMLGVIISLFFVRIPRTEEKDHEI